MSSARARVPPIVVDLRKQLLDATDAFPGGENLARRAAAELHRRPIEPLRRLSASPNTRPARSITSAAA
jgi:hypothetical protein